MAFGFNLPLTFSFGSVTLPIQDKTGFLKEIDP
jgi:hypothetical protein